jgi:hypothetical protein
LNQLLDLLIQYKRGEQKFLKKELEDATSLTGDTDYEYASLIAPILGSVNNEIKRFESLSATIENTNGPDFKFCVREVLTGKYYSFEIHIYIDGYIQYNGPLVQISRMKSKNKLKCEIIATEELRQYLSYDADLQMKKNKWKSDPGGKKFTQTFTIRNEEDFPPLHIEIAKVLLDTYKGLITVSKKQHYVLIQHKQL